MVDYWNLTHAELVRECQEKDKIISDLQAALVNAIPSVEMEAKVSETN